MIIVKELSKKYKVHKKEEGVRGSLKSLFHREYRTIDAVNNISISIESGEIVGFIGPNGAGKTTTIKMLSGLLYPTDGEAKVMGYTPWKRQKEYLKSIGLVLGNKSQLLWDIPAIDSFAINRDIYGISDDDFKKKVSELSEILGVNQLLHVPVRNLSLGERMKMEIISSILHSPGTLFLDEPTIGLDLISQKNLRNFFADYNKKYGVTILLTSHYIEDIVSLCKRIIIINHGKIVYDGPINRINNAIGNHKIIKASFLDILEQHVLDKLNLSIKQQKESEYIFNVEYEKLPEAFTMLSSLKPYDISIQDQPIEDIIESIYLGMV